MSHLTLIAALVGAVSLLYATAGQAGGTAFLAVMAFTGVAASEMRPTALLLNIVVAGYSTWRLHRRNAIEWGLLSTITLPSLVTAFAGGLLVLPGHAYSLLTGLLLIAAAGLMLLRRRIDTGKPLPVKRLPAALVGAGTGLLAGLTGIGGGVFLVSQLVALGWTSPRRAAALSPPFILCNSILGLAGVLVAGQPIAPAAPLYALAALVGAIFGTAIGLRWMSEHATRYVLSAILLFSGLHLLIR